MSELSAQLQELRLRLSGEINAELMDSDVLRFLRARNFDMDASLKMVNEWHEWRYKPISEASHLTPANLLTTANFVDKKESLYATLMPHSNLARDKTGRPIYYEKTGLISNQMDDILKKFTSDEIIIRHIRQQELMVKVRMANFIVYIYTKQLTLKSYIMIIFKLNTIFVHHSG